MIDFIWFLTLFCFDGRLVLCFLIFLIIFILLIVITKYLIFQTVFYNINYLILYMGFLLNNWTVTKYIKTNINKYFTWVLLMSKLMSNFTIVSFEFRINIPILRTIIKDYRGLCFEVFLILYTLAAVLSIVLIRGLILLFYLSSLGFMHLSSIDNQDDGSCTGLFFHIYSIFYVIIPEHPLTIKLICHLYST